jgi:hypothetical protein
MSDSTATRAEFRSNGGLANFSANNVNLSDARVKTILGASPSHRDRFSKLTFVEGRYKDSTRQSTDVMLTAQDVELIYPELVEPFSVELKGVREQGLIMRALKVVQELDAESRSLAARVAVLEGRP